MRKEVHSLNQTAQLLAQYVPETALAVIIVPLLHRITLFLVVCSYLLKKVHTFYYDFIHLVHSQIMLENFILFYLFILSKQRDFHQFLELSDPLLGYNVTKERFPRV